MADITNKRLSIHNLRAGMMLTGDVMTPNGQLLIPNGTQLTESHLFRMNLYQILSASVSFSNGSIDDEYLNADVLDHDLPLPTEAFPNQQHRLYRTEGFLRFNKTLLNADKVIREHFNQIVLGGTVDCDQLLAAVKSVLNTVRVKSELFTYMSHIHANDQHTYIHSLSVAMLCNIFGQWLKYDSKDLDQLTMAGLMHDIGKTQISAELLNKEGPLSEEEFEQLRQHAQLGYDILKDKDIPTRIKEAVHLHHERIDGSGYPYGHDGTSIPDFAKIIAIVDVYNAMTSNRSYHIKFSPFSVIQLFEHESYDHLDNEYLNIFLENMAHYYLGERVLLTNGIEGKIVFIHNEAPSRPIIQASFGMIDLMKTPEIAIQEIL